MYVSKGQSKAEHRVGQTWHLPLYFSFDNSYWSNFRQHFYVGSANFDWRSLTQVKEIGVLVQNCPTLATDMSKIFEVYWMLGGQSKTIPDR